MLESGPLPLRLVDALELGAELRDALRPGEVLEAEQGREQTLPRFFYEVPSWKAANEIQLTPHFQLAELLRVDVREAEPLRSFPRYVPCAITLLAMALELLRQAAGSPVYVAANGGYRSPSHGLTHGASPHCWGTAANIYRIGDDFLDSQSSIQEYGEMAKAALPGGWVRPFGRGDGFVDDHLHLDIGYATVTPHDAPADDRGAG